MMSAELEAVEKDFFHGGLTVGTSVVQLTDNQLRLMKGVIIKADAANTNIIYVGGPNVATSGTTTKGLALAAGEGVYIPLAFAHRLYVIAGAASQNLSFFAV